MLSRSLMAQTVQSENATERNSLPVTPLRRGGAFVELRRSFPSKVTAIPPTVDQLMRFIAMFRNTGASEADLEIALHAAIANAVIHGNHEDLCKRVYVTCRCRADGEVSITVRDEEPGFDNGTVPDLAESASRLSIHGRGVHLMRSSMDEVRFEGGGTVVGMHKKSNAGSNQDPARRVQ